MLELWTPLMCNVKEKPLGPLTLIVMAYSWQDMDYFYATLMHFMVLESFNTNVLS